MFLLQAVEAVEAEGFERIAQHKVPTFLQVFTMKSPNLLERTSNFAKVINIVKKQLPGLWRCPSRVDAVVARFIYNNERAIALCCNCC